LRQNFFALATLAAEAPMALPQTGISQMNTVPPATVIPPAPAPTILACQVLGLAGVALRTRAQAISSNFNFICRRTRISTNAH
jgi:hypothetical protein